MINALQMLLALYRNIPASTCKGFCGETSCGTVPFSKTEWLAIPAHLKKGKTNPPYLEGLNTMALREKEWHTTGENTYPACQFLENGQCTIYDHRPPICRLYGQVDEISQFDCQFGCEKNITPEMCWAILQTMGEIYRAAGDAKKLEAARDTHLKWRDAHLYEPGEKWLTIRDNETGTVTRYGRIE
jgi:Fe-S-cluster containining protein